MSKRAVWLAFATFAIVMGSLSLLRFHTFHSRSLDMAYYVRLVWGIAHGYWDQPVVGAPHLLGLHLEPILLPFALLARAGLPIADTLLVAQALTAAAAIFPAARLSGRRLGPLVGERWAFAAALTIYLLPTVTRCVDYDFHPSTMAIAPLAALIDALDAGRWRAAWGWAAASLAFREDVGLQIGCVALTFALWPPRRARVFDTGRAPTSGPPAPSDDPRQGTPMPAQGPRGARMQAVFLALLGFVWFSGYALAIQPRWLPPAGSYDLHFPRFGGNAAGAGGVLAAALGDPIGLFGHLVSGDRPLYPILLLAQVAFLPLLAPRWLAGALPLVAINLLSELPGVRTLGTHYLTAAAPFFAAAATDGCARIVARKPRFARLAPAALLLAAQAAFWLRGASPLSPEWRFGAYVMDDYARRARALVAATPPDAEVTAPSRVLAHLAARRVARWTKNSDILVVHGDP